LNGLFAVDRRIKGRSAFGLQKCGIEPSSKAGNLGAMKLLCAFAVWIGMGVVLGAGILMAIKGSPWLLIAGLIGFIVAVGRIGCMSH
jgi:F0F1-type ATP synthase assembly protein I